VLRNTFPDHIFSRETHLTECESLSEVEKIGCLWAELQGQTDRVKNVTDVQLNNEVIMLDFLRKAQRLMQNTASNYQVSSLYAGCVTAGIAVLIAVWVAYRKVRIIGTSASFLTAILLAYGGMMFASSYVEEEQQFWYWISSAWIAILHVKLWITFVQRSEFTFW
jgi:ethanolaminephosphotransferase